MVAGIIGDLDGVRYGRHQVVLQPARRLSQAPVRNILDAHAARGIDHHRQPGFWLMSLLIHSLRIQQTKSNSASRSESKANQSAALQPGDSPFGKPIAGQQDAESQSPRNGQPMQSRWVSELRHGL